MALQLELVTPEKLIFSAPANLVEVPGSEGDMGILEGHAPLISQLRAGVVEIVANDNKAKKVFVAGGFVEVTPERCTILAEEAALVSEIKADEVKTRLADAKRDYDHAKDESAKVAAEKRVAIAEAMVEALGKK